MVIYGFRSFGALSVGLGVWWFGFEGELFFFYFEWLTLDVYSVYSRSILAYFGFAMWMVLSMSQRHV